MLENNNIRKENCTVREIDKYLFPKEIICQAIEDYASICKITVNDEVFGFQCSFFSESVSAELIADEFENYLIELMQ